MGGGVVEYQPKVKDQLLPRSLCFRRHADRNRLFENASKTDKQAKKEGKKERTKGEKTKRKKRRTANGECTSYYANI